MTQQTKNIVHHVWTSALIGGGAVLLGYLSQATQIHDTEALRAFIFTVGGAVLGGVLSGIRAALLQDIPALDTPVSLNLTPGATYTATATNTDLVSPTELPANKDSSGTLPINQ